MTREERISRVCPDRMVGHFVKNHHVVYEIKMFKNICPEIHCKEENKVINKNYMTKKNYTLFKMFVF